MLRKSTLYFVFSFLILSCTPTAQVSDQPVVVKVFASSATQPWLTDLFTCANQQALTLNVTADSPDIYLQLGEPAHLISPSYQIDEEEILIVTHRQSPIQNLSLAEAQALFAGEGDVSIQVWSYAADEDVQILFDQFVMKESSVSSSTHLASSPQIMSDLLNSESNSVGILPRHWKVGDVREVYSVGKVPVLAIINEETEITRSLITCLSK